MALWAFCHSGFYPSDILLQLHILHFPFILEFFVFTIILWLENAWPHSPHTMPCVSSFGFISTVIYFVPSRKSRMASITCCLVLRFPHSDDGDGDIFQLDFTLQSACNKYGFASLFQFLDSYGITAVVIGAS